MARTNARANAASGGRADEAPSATERVRAELLMLRRDRDALRGECAELREQLKQQRERTEHLARDLGRAEALTAVPARLGLVDRLAGWLRRRDGADNRVGKNVGAALRAEPSGAVVGRSDAIVPFVTQRRAPRVLMAVMIGLDAEALERALMPIRESSGDGETEMETLCLTDCGRFELFRRHRLLFEYFPPPQQQERFASNLDWNLYTLRRLARLRRKWSPVRIVAFGPIAQAQIQLWRASPFEDDRIKDLIRAPDAAIAATDVVGD
jgi:hypothetical protein